MYKIIQINYVLIVLSLFFSLNNADAGIANVFGIGAKSMSMGATSFLHQEETAFSAYSAPAILGYSKHPNLSLGWMKMEANLRPFGEVVIDPSGTKGDFNSAAVLGGKGNLLGLSIPIGPSTRPLTFAIVAYLSSDSVSRVSGSPTNFPFYPQYQDVSRNTFLSFGLGYRIYQGISLGFGTGTSLLTLTDLQIRNDSTASFNSTAVEVRNEIKPSFSLSNDFSYFFPELALTSAFTYKAKSEIRTRTNVSGVISGVPIDGELNSVPFFSPAAWTLANSYAFSKNLKIALDISRIAWSAYPNPFSSGNLNFLLIGDSNRNAGFKDIWVPRFGSQYTIHSSGWIKRWNARLGYFYYPSPAPEQTADTNFVDNNRHAVTLGAGIAFKNPWQDSFIQLDSFFQYNYLVKKQVTKNSATNIGAPGYTTGGSILSYGIMTSLAF